MLKKIKNIIYLFSFSIFIILIITFYFSEENMIRTNKTRSFYSLKQINELKDLTLLKNDTNNIIEHKDDVEIYKKEKKKYKFWDLIRK